MVVEKIVYYLKFCDNTYSLGKYSPNSKKYCPESGTPTLNEGEQRGGEGPRCSLSTFELPNEGCGPLEVQFFLMKDFIPSEFVCNFIYSL
jgi:hypothetical protein